MLFDDAILQVLTGAAAGNISDNDHAKQQDVDGW